MHVARRWFLATALAATVAVGCSTDERQAELEAASAELAEARAERQEMLERVAERRAAAEAAAQELAAAEAELAAVDERLTAAVHRVDEHATDGLLFRSVQRQLLEDAALEDVAIAASVENGVVTLAGIVANADQRDRALEIANATPGVVRVEERIQIAPADVSAQE
ncbi:MAG: BON domain-containing protein [Proteobacteria bacterium]|nr:BON domain-containing protein [Pseudomonadota bacterium]